MSPLRLTGSTSGYSQIDAPAVAGDQLFTLPGTGGTLDRLNRAGNILQVVQATYSTSTSNSTTTYADTGLTASITPSSSSNKVLIFVNQSSVTKDVGNVGNACTLKLLRGTTDLLIFSQGAGYTNSSLANIVGTQNTVYLDSPASTSAVTYKTQFRNDANAAQVTVQANSTMSTMILMEVAA